MIPDIPLKTSDDVDAVRRSCRIAAQILESTARHIREGISSLELDRIAAALMRQFGVSPGVPEGFPGSICVSVNDIAAHGVPDSRKLKTGDILTVDITVLCRGWYGDLAASYPVGSVSGQRRRLLESSRMALHAAMQAVRAGSRMGDVGAAVLEAVEKRSCVVLPEFVGHGIGRSLHEEPAVPHTGRRGEGLPIVPGMVLTVEPAVALTASPLRKLDDGWSLKMSDRSPVAQFEHTLAVFSDRTEVLTKL